MGVPVQHERLLHAVPAPKNDISSGTAKCLTGSGSVYVKAPATIGAATINRGNTLFAL